MTSVWLKILRYVLVGALRFEIHLYAYFLHFPLLRKRNLKGGLFRISTWSKLNKQRYFKFRYEMEMNFRFEAEANCINIYICTTWVHLNVESRHIFYELGLFKIHVKGEQIQSIIPYFPTSSNLNEILGFTTFVGYRILIRHLMQLMVKHGLSRTLRSANMLFAFFYITLWNIGSNFETWGWSEQVSYFAFYQSYDYLEWSITLPKSDTYITMFEVLSKSNTLEGYQVERIDIAVYELGFKCPKEDLAQKRRVIRKNQYYNEAHFGRTYLYRILCYHNVWPNHLTTKTYNQIMLNLSLPSYWYDDNSSYIQT